MWDVYIYFSLLLLSLIFWIIRFKHLQAGLRILGLTLLINCIMEGYAAYLMFHMTNNLYLYNILIPVQYALYALVFYTGLVGGKEIRLILLSIPLYLVVTLLIILHLQTFSEFNSYTRLMKDVLIACWALLYYREVFTGLRVIRLHKEPMFWISTGLFFYSLGSFFSDGFMDYLLGLSYKMAHMLYYINVFLGLLLNVTFLIAFMFSKNHSRGFRDEPYAFNSAITKDA